MIIEFSKSASKDYQRLKKENNSLHKKIKLLIEDIIENGNRGKPEKLKYALSGYMSRRITQEHRLVYRIENDKLYIYSCYYHYD
jgi:toxin-antitoxin system, toxin component, Txe/YoeB family